MYYWFGEHGELGRCSRSTRCGASVTAAPLARFEVSGRGSAVSESVRSPALSFGVAPDGSGVPSTSTAMASQKSCTVAAMALYPHKPRFRENATSVSWLREDYPRLSAAERPRECVIRPGDLLYFPRGWWHAIISVGETVFMSTFL